MGQREMTDHPTVTATTAAAADLLAQAHRHPSRRAARTLVSGTSQRVTLIALTGGTDMAEHDAPPAATLHVLTGRIRLHTKESEWVLGPGDLAAVPPQRHGLTALDDTVVLLTVALR
jgi:quercetin dioxygenase-like cupin family protein